MLVSTLLKEVFFFFFSQHPLTELLLFFREGWGFMSPSSSVTAVDKSNLMQVLTAALSPRLQCPCYSWKTAFHSTPSFLQLLHVFISLFYDAH